MALEGVVSGIGSLFHGFFPYLIWIILIGAAIMAYLKIRKALGYS
jgi:uncharacterized membrane protein YdbT with pleckstrin-like domain